MISSGLPAQPGVVMGAQETFGYARGGCLNVGLVAMGWSPDVGGVQSHTADLARELIARGHQVYALCLDTSGARGPFETFDTDVDGVCVRRVAYSYGDHAGLRDLLEHPRLADVVLGWMAETPCDLIHVHHLSGFGVSALRAIHDVGQPLVMTLHDYWLLDPRGQLFRPDGTRRGPGDAAAMAEDLRATWPHLLPSGGADGAAPGGGALGSDEELCRAWIDHALDALRLPQQLVAPSRAAARVFEEAGVPAGRIRVVENGVDAVGLAREVARLRNERPRSGALRLGVIGTVLPSKGVLELARAFVDARIEGLELVIAGNAVPYHGDRTTIDAIERLAAEHAGIELRGEFEHAELPALLAGLDGVAAPSRWDEVFGLTVREARATGLPVLVSDAGALPDVTDGGRAGLVVGADDAAGWVEALRRFAEDAGARAAWAAHPAPVHDTAAMTDDLLAVYCDAIEAATGRRPALGGAPAAPADAGEQPGTRRRSLFARLFGRGS